MENKVDKRELRLGNMFKEGVVCKINGRTGAKVHLYGKLRFDKRIKVIDQVPAELLTPIKLDNDILVKWCDLGNGVEISRRIEIWENRVRDGSGRFEGYIVSVSGTTVILAKIDYLHELQNLYYVLNKKELTIKELQNLETFPINKK